ncbi:hypothetical protein VIGAN_05064800, partial [Vigna angularis var. angularis]
LFSSSSTSHGQHEVHLQLLHSLSSNYDSISFSPHFYCRLSSTQIVIFIIYFPLSFLPPFPKPIPPKIGVEGIPYFFPLLQL